MAKTDELWPDGGYGIRMRIDAKTEEAAFKIAQKIADQLRTDVTVTRTFTGRDYVPFHTIKAGEY